MPTDGSRVWQPEICSSAGLHHVYAVRRHRFSREAHCDKVWTSAGRVETQLSRSTRQNTSVPCCCRFGSIRFDDVGHVVTGCTGVAVVVDSPQQHHDGKLLGRIWCAPAAAPSSWVMRRWTGRRRATGMASLATVRVFSAVPGLVLVRDAVRLVSVCGQPKLDWGDLWVR